MTAHTPGPWVTADAFGHNVEGTAVQSTHDDNLVCSCTGYYGREGAQANARLIAAAPELLEALRRCRFDSLNMSLADLDFCRAAIAKATSP